MGGRWAAHSRSQGRRKQLRDTRGLLGEGDGHAFSLGWLSQACGFFTSQRMETGKEERGEGQVQAPLARAVCAAGLLGLFLPLPVPHPSAKLGFTGFWLCLRGPSSDEPPPPSAGLERNCQPETPRELPRVKTGEGRKEREPPRESSAVFCLLQGKPRHLTSAPWRWDHKSCSQGTWF